MVNKKMTVNDVAERLTKLETISHERWKTAFNEFSDIKQEITLIFIKFVFYTKGDSKEIIQTY